MGRLSLLKPGAMTALAAAITLTAMPAHAQDREGGRQRENAAGEMQVRPERGNWAERRQQAQGDSGNAGIGGAGNGWAERRQQVQAQEQSQASTGNSWAERRAERAATAQPQPPQALADSARQRYWNGRNENTGARPHWERAPVPAQVGTVTPAEPRRDGSGGNRDQTRQPHAQGQTSRDWSGRDWSNREGNRDRDGIRHGRDWAGRNRTYTDPARNSEYRDGNRNGRWQDRDGHWQDRNRNDGNRDGRWNSGNGYRDGHNAWNRNWRQNNQYNWYGYRNRNRSNYRIGRYYAPYRSYYYRPISIGFQLQSLFFSNRYWINDPWQYRLPAAYGPYRWVRYYDDVLLVDIYSGEVVDVIQNFFW